MQDEAPSHSAFMTLAEPSMNRIQPLTWPAFSLDLKPIEAVQIKMKDFIERKYPGLPDSKERSYDELCVLVREVWGSVTPENLVEFIKSMSRKYQAIIDANGGHMKR